MWQRFTERARRIVFYAQEEATRLGENYVGPEHILLGLVRENDSAAARILDRLGVPLGRIRSDVERQVTHGHGNLGQDMQLTPRAKRVIDLAYEEARQLNNNYIGTEHLLLGLIREGDSLAARVLVRLGADLERTRREVYAAQEGDDQQRLIAQARAASLDDADPALAEETTQLLQLAQEEAASGNAACVGTEHLLQAVTRAPDSFAARALERLGAPLGRLRSTIPRMALGSPPGPPPVMLFTWHALGVLDLAYDEGRQLQNDYVGAEHLLLALLQEGDSSAAHALREAGVTWDRARAAACRLQREGAASSEQRAGQFLDQARQEAEAVRQSAVSTEHLLLSLIRDEAGVAARILEVLGASPAALRGEMERQLAPVSNEPEGSPAEKAERPLTPRAAAVIDRAREEARKLRGRQVGSEHLLLALALDGEGFAAQVLNGTGATALRLLTVLPRARTAEPAVAVVREARPASEEAPQDQPAAELLGEGWPPESPRRRFTQRARRVAFFAQEEAVRLGENYVGTEHLLLGLVRENDSVAARVLDGLGVPLGRIRSDIERQVTRGHHNPGQKMQLTPRAERVINLAFEEARQLNNNYIGTEHLLLGMIREGDGLAARILVKLGADLERARREVYAMQVSETQSAPTQTPPPTATAEPPRTEEAAPERLEALTDPAAWVEMAPAGRRQAARAAAAAARALVAREGRLLDFTSINDLTPAQARALLSLAQALKASGDGDRLAHREILPGKVLAMIFEKPSLRTRVTFETGMFQMGGHAVPLQPTEIRLGERETVADAARNLERWVDGIMARTFRHEHVVELAQNAGVPVINGLTDQEHPCQALADFLTIREKKGRTEGLKLAFLGDGNNVAHSLLLLGAKLGTHVTVAGPEGYEPDAGILRQAREIGAATGAQIEVTHDPVEAVRDADMVYTDVWASMGQEAEAAERAPHFAPFQLNAELLKHAKWDALVMHDLPAHRGEEITDEVMDGPQAVIFDQAENRLHAQKALLAVLLG